MKRIANTLLIVLTIATICTLLVGCNALEKWLNGLSNDSNTDTTPTEEVQALGTPVLRTEGNRIYWDAIEGADRYRIRYNDTNEPTAATVEILVYQPMVDVDALDLPAGNYLFVVRAECTTGGYLDGTYTPTDKGVNIVISREVTLDEVTLNVYRVDDDTVLCTWAEAVGAATYHVQVGDTVADSSGLFALVAADATKDLQVTLTVTGKPGYPYDGLSVTADYQARTAESVARTDYDKQDESLTFPTIINPSKVSLDGYVLNRSFTGQLTLDAELLREQEVGVHLLQATTRLSTHLVLITISDTRALVIVNGVGVSIDEIDYTLSSKGLVVYFEKYANTVTSITLDEVALTAEACSIAEESATITRAYIADLGEGDHVLRVLYTNMLGVASSASLTVHVVVPNAFTYDVASGANCEVSPLPAGVTGIIGGGITTDDYVLTSTKLTINSAYLSGLSAGEYQYWLQGGEGALVTLSVFNSAKAPYDVLLTYDDHVTDAYGHFKCDCGMTRHYYSLDGGTNVAIEGNSVKLGQLVKSQNHSFAVYCATNNQTTTYSIKPNSTAVTYMSSRYNFEGRNPDCYIGSVAEFGDVVRYLSYAGNFNLSKGEYGVSEMTVYLGNDVMSMSGDINSALSALLSAARQGFSAPFDCAISAKGDDFNVNTRMGPLTVTITFGDSIAKTHVNGIAADAYNDRRNLLTAGATTRTTYIESIAATEDVGNVQELADLPMGIRPVFTGSDAATQAASTAWQAALTVCKTFIRDGMSTTQKLQVMFDYLSRYITYDYYALVWYEVDNYRKSMEQDAYRQWQSSAATYQTYCSTAEKEAIEGTHTYAAAAELVNRMMTNIAGGTNVTDSSFWSAWQSNFATYESTATDYLRTYARQQVTSRGYTGTSLDTDVETMCAATSYADTVDVLAEMVASSAFDCYGALVGNVAVCDGIADAFRVLCLVEGIPCRKISGIGNNSSGGSEAHAWNKVLVGDTWYCVDATWSTAAGCVSHRYFLVPDSVLSADHLEQVGDVQAIDTLALAAEYNYYANTVIGTTNLYAADLTEFSAKFKALYQAGQRTIEMYIATAPGSSAFKSALEDAVGKVGHVGSYTYTYNRGYAVITF